MKHLVLTTVVSLILSNLSAQQPSSIIQDFKLQHIKTGMSQSSATQILEDSHGFLWIGTPNGLNKYDGTDFQIFNKSLDGKTGLTDGYVEKIYEDGNGQLLIGTNQGLNVYDRSLNHVVPYPFKPEAQFLQSKYFGAIAKQNDFLWLGTDSDGVYRYNTNTGETKQLKFEELMKGGPSNHFIVELFPIGYNQILMITQVSTYLINNDLQVVTKIKGLQDIASALQIGHSSFLLGGNDGTLTRLVIDDNFNFLTSKNTISEGHKILSLTEDNERNLWLGTENDGLYIFNYKNQKLQHFTASVSRPHSISSSSIWALYKAKNGVIWMSPFKNGLSFYDTKYLKFRHLSKDPFGSNSLSNNIVNCFNEDKRGNLWIGTDGGGLNYWNRATDTYEHFSNSNGRMHSDVILSIFEDDKEQLWIGSWANGLAIFDSKTKKFEQWTKENSFLGSNNVIDIHQDKKGRMWVVTLFGGLHVYYPDSGKSEDISLRSEKDGSEAATVARLLEDDKGQIWVGSQTKGLFRLVEKDNRWVPVHYHSVHENRKLSNDFINTVVQDNDGAIWVGTQAGLDLYQPNSDTFKSFTREDGLRDDAIRGIVQDKEGYLWLSTGNGITRFDKNTIEFVDFDVKDGLQGNEFNASSSLLTNSGELAFGGSSGFNIFTPTEVQRRKSAPKIYISGLKIFNKNVKPNDEFGVLSRDISQTDSLTLTYDLDVVNFEFHALTYRHPERVSFAYFLENFETEWNYVGQDKNATYTSLNPGEYVLRIKSTNSDGVWVDNETSLHLTITPPFWKTWWFRSIFIGALALSLFVTHKIRVNKMERYQVKLEDKIDERTAELRLQKKKLLEAADTLSTRNEEIQRFAFAVSHDLKSPLNSIKGIASLIPMEIDLNDYPEMKEYVSFIDETCDTMNNLISDISEIARLGKIENKMAVLDTTEILDVASNLVMGRLLESNTSLVVDTQLPEIYGDHNRILQVFENLIDNAIKYMGKQKIPVVKVEAKLKSDGNEFHIIDNGSGMDKRALEKLFTPFERFDGSVEGTGLGLYMVKKIVESHNGKIWAKSAGKNLGSTFVIKFPKVENKNENDKMVDKNRSLPIT